MKIIFICIIVLILGIKSVRACFSLGNCPKLGESCKDSCAPGLECVNGKCQSMTLCDPNLPISEDTCTGSFLCTRINDTVGVCLQYVSQKLDGSALCSRPANCASGICQNSICMPPQSDMCITNEHCNSNKICFFMGNWPNGYCINKSDLGPCAYGVECYSGAYINGNCVPIYSGKENDTCSFVTKSFPFTNPCDVGLTCMDGKCVKYVEKKACNSTVPCGPYETCQCNDGAIGENGVCKIKYKLDAECKNATDAIIACAKSHQECVDTPSYVLQQSCSREYCDYKNKCFKPQFFGCNQTELFKMCPSDDYTKPIDTDSSDSDSTSSSNSSSSHDSSSSKQTSSNSSSSSIDNLFLNY
ncbi:hypothetical protein DICPUDRAFT_157478 [Dictyostelium purpureum]|uniref:Dickkopf N-terminal cysteine-rich domain-containing protein n=1 Tax=Dictyostelium purpureum TaxID=5786 RepID=F0ZZ84_DICPU|nr:uncharacterized protein DICPUDRAFT_157478 [Dictyostelium purpureum]EGC30749.1 hypothetical protein DICPUDRAFT_157478 [Dictyostelium purpureum]|eukprot:XP_003292733.1 hypothetical protein DICPUDRAFT_157478 [Dictyostelium purpureum]